LRSRIHEKDVTKADITIQGYIVAENISDAPKCALHKVGKKDPDDCPPPVRRRSRSRRSDRRRQRRWRRQAAHSRPRLGEELRHGLEAMEKYKLLKVKDPTRISTKTTSGASKSVPASPSRQGS